MLENGELLTESDIFLKINYYAYGNSNQLNGVDDFYGIEEFKTDIKSSYKNSIIRPIPTGRGGAEAYQFFIDVIVPNVSLYYFLNSIMSGTIHDVFKYSLDKLYLAIKKLGKKNKSEGNIETQQGEEKMVYRIKVDFEDTSVFYYCWDNNKFYEDMTQSFKSLKENYASIHNFGYVKSSEPSFIVFPVLPIEKASELEIREQNYTKFISPEHADLSLVKKQEFYRYFSCYYPIGCHLVVDTKNNFVSEEHLLVSELYQKAFP